MTTLDERFADVPVLGTALRVLARYKQDAGNQHAAAIAFFGFLSLLPVVLVALAVTGFVLAGDPDAQARLLDAVSEAVPGLDEALGPILASLVDHRGTVGLIGLVGLLLTGVRVVDASVVATTRILRVEADLTGLRLRARQLLALAALGSLAIAGVAVGGVVGADLPGVPAVARTAGGVLASFAFDVVLFVAAYRLLSLGRGPSARELVPGAVLAAVGWTALKVFGSTYVAGQIAAANALYGTLAAAVGALLLLYLAARLYLYGAVLSTVLVEGDPTVPDRLPTQEPRPFVSDETRARLAVADSHRAELRHAHPVRHALAFALAVGTVAALVASSGILDPDAS